MKKIALYCDSQSAIHICYNPVQHLKMIHIALRYHFTKDHAEDGNIDVHFVKTIDQFADIFTKPLDEKSFLRILNGQGMMKHVVFHISLEIHLNICFTLLLISFITFVYWVKLSCVLFTSDCWCSI